MTVIQRVEITRQYQLMGVQRELGKMARKLCGIEAVRYSQYGSGSGEGGCLSHTFRWIQRMAEYGNEPLQGTLGYKIGELHCHKEVT